MTHCRLSLVTSHKSNLPNKHGKQGCGSDIQVILDVICTDNSHYVIKYQYTGGWWYQACHHGNLNGLYQGLNNTTYAQGVNWLQFRGYFYSLRLTEMKFRPIGFTLKEHVRNSIGKELKLTIRFL